jgi:hypothetical protein
MGEAMNRRNLFKSLLALPFGKATVGEYETVAVEVVKTTAPIVVAGMSRLDKYLLQDAIRMKEDMLRYSKARASLLSAMKKH